MAIEVYKNVTVKLDDTNQLIYTCPPLKSCVVHSLYCANLLDESIFPTFSFRDSSSNIEYNLGEKIKIPLRSTMSWDKPINLEAGDSIYINANTSVPDPANVFLSVMELYDNTFEKYRNSSKVLSTTNQILYTCPSNRANAIIHSLQFSNIDHNGVGQYSTVTITFQNELGDIFVLGRNIKIPPNVNFIWDKTINLSSGQKLLVRSDSSNNVHCVASILEVEANV